MDIGFRKFKPKPGVLVRYPRTYAALPESGAVVPITGPEGRYWRRRLTDGDVIDITDEEVKESETKRIRNAAKTEEEK